MTEEKKITLTQVEEENQEKTDDTKQKEILIPVKFNKETKNLSLEEASSLAQKGMKYDSIKEEYDTLKELASAEGKSVAEYLKDIKEKKTETRLNELIDKCGGDKETAEHFLSLEMKENKSDDGFGEIKKYFPEISSKEDLPEEVLQNQELHGSMLLDEYLRYLLKARLNTESNKKQNENAQNKSVGSQLNKNGEENRELNEFLKGIWKK